MAELPTVITGSHLWRSTLAKREDDRFSTERDRLRVAFTTLRERSALLATGIRKDLPELPVHDITHLDSLWEIASVIAGDRYSLSPTEGFVLGGAFLLHDLGMSMAAIEGGLSTLKGDPRWADLLTYEYQTSFDRNPTPDEIDRPDEQIRGRVLFSLLRQIHAAKAEKLAFLFVRASAEAERIHLLEDAEVRQTFGRIMGRVAHSHWWTLQEVEREFTRAMGAPHWCPPDWTIDPLKVAALLRVADAAHVDASRAPSFLRAISHLRESVEEHWTFQGKLNKPYLAEDSLVYTTGQAFRVSEASAWWLCLETLRMVDRELGSVDALFADKGNPRFAARRVAGVDSPERLVSYIQTDGWLPINATIHVTDLPRVIKSVGGEELYGRHPEVALRELIQNACDAIQARRVYERRSQNFGAIRVSLTEQAGDVYWLEVDDDGIGMSKRVLTDFLLDFGRGFWGSAEMQREFPGLLSSGIRQIGKYGIGFFAVFMIAEQVQVITKRSDAAAKDTLVLEFSSGLKGRPLLRPAETSEQRIDGGTCVRVKLKSNPFSEGGLLYESRRHKKRSLADLCIEVCPALEVELVLREGDREQALIRGGDWRTLSDEKFLERMPLTKHDGEDVQQEDADALRKRAAPNLRFLRNERGEIVGRALITAGWASHQMPFVDLGGLVTVGGLTACSLSGIAGVLAGTPMRASRDSARPLVSDDELRRWADEQATLVPRLWDNPQIQAACAQYVRLCGGHTKNLPICMNKGRWYSAQEIAGRTDVPFSIIIVDDFVVDHELSLLESYTLDDNVFVTEFSGIPGLLQCDVDWPRGMRTNFAWGGRRFFSDTLGGALVEAVAQAWAVDVRAVAEANQLERENSVTIGKTGDRPLRVQAIRVVRPSV